MTHLSSAELADAVEGGLAGDRADHLTECDRCRRLADDLRAALAAARDVDVPEPSPLFWASFSARVREAVAAEPARRRFWVQTWRPVMGLAAGVALVALVVAVSWWYAKARPTPPREAAAVSGAADPLAGLDASRDDGSWLLVTTVAGDLVWDDTVEAGLVVRPGSVDRAVLMLTAEERSELARLLTAELPRSKL
jgi:hypothetical protein